MHMSRVHVHVMRVQVRHRGRPDTLLVATRAACGRNQAICSAGATPPCRPPYPLTGLPSYLSPALSSSPPLQFSSSPPLHFSASPCEWHPYCRSNPSVWPSSGTRTASQAPPKPKSGRPRCAAPGSGWTAAAQPHRGTWVAIGGASADCAVLHGVARCCMVCMALAAHAAC